MKKLICLILVIVMSFSCGTVTFATESPTNKIDIPKMPVASDNIIGYAASSGTEGSIPSGAVQTPTTGWDPVAYPSSSSMYDMMKSGGTVVANGKLFIGATCTVRATDTPVRFTAVDTEHNRDYRSRNADGSYNVTSAGQKGMLMIVTTSTNHGIATFMGDVIFDDICILDRSPAGVATPSTLEVGSTGRMVITNTVDFISTGEYNSKLSVREGGYLYLDALGFESISGEGTVVLGDLIVDRVTADTFAGFCGIVCTSDGTVMYDMRVNNNQNVDMIASPVYAIDTTNKTLIYENNFDTADALADFVQYNGKFTVKDGRAVLDSYSKATNAFILYAGNAPELRNLKEYVIEVDLYNVQTAAGLVAFCELSEASNAGHGYAGYNVFVNSTGQKPAIRTASEDGKSNPFLKVCPWRINPGDDIHIEAAVCGDIVQVRFSYLSDGREFWTFSLNDTAWRGSSFGLMAYTKIYDDVLDCRKSSFDNLRISVLQDKDEQTTYKTVGGSFEYGYQARATADGSIAVAENINNSMGSASVKTFLPAEGNVGLVFGYGEDGSYYKFAVSSDKKLHLIKVSGGKTTTLKTTSLSAMGTGQWGVCELRAVYYLGKIYCYLNNKCLLAYTDKNYLTGGGVGIFSDKAGGVLLGLSTSLKTEPDSADIVMWGHSHMQAWYYAAEDLSEHGVVANLGVGGSNTPYWNALTNEISSYNADIIIVMSGSNDMGKYSVNQIVAYLKDTFAKIKAKNPDVHFILITEWLQPSRLETYGDKVREMEQRWRQLADEDPLSITIVDGYSIPLDEDGNFSDALFTDTQHMGVLGYTELEKRVSAAIENVKAGVFIGGGSYTNIDLTLLVRRLAGWDIDVPDACLDVTGDGKLTNRDALMLIKKITEWNS